MRHHWCGSDGGYPQSRRICMQLPRAGEWQGSALIFHNDCAHVERPIAVDEQLRSFIRQRGVNARRNFFTMPSTQIEARGLHLSVSPERAPSSGKKQPRMIRLRRMCRLDLHVQVSRPPPRTEHLTGDGRLRRHCPRLTLIHYLRFDLRMDLPVEDPGLHLDHG